MHTQASQLYNQVRIPQHTVQLYACMVVRMYLLGRYGLRVQSHQRLISVALERMERIR